MADRKRESHQIGDLASNGRDLCVIARRRGCNGSGNRSICLRMHFLVNALGIEVVGRWDRATEFSATSKSHYDLVPITLLPIT